MRKNISGESNREDRQEGRKERGLMRKGSREKGREDRQEKRKDWGLIHSFVYVLHPQSLIFMRRDIAKPGDGFPRDSGILFSA